MHAEKTTRNRDLKNDFFFNFTLRKDKLAHLSIVANRQLQFNFNNLLFRGTRLYINEILNGRPASMGLARNDFVLMTQ